MRYIIIVFLFFQVFAVKANHDSLTVYIFLSETCPICQNQTYSLRELYKEFGEKHIGFVGVFPNQEFSTNESIVKFGKKYRLPFPLIKDDNQVLTQKLNATITPQVIVCQYNTNKIEYSGKIDNSFERIGRRRQVITEFYLRDALNELIQGKQVTLQATSPVGCFIIKN